MSEVMPIEGDIEDFLAQHERKQLLRFVAVGSVDDGKSTLIGRLLHDTQGVYEDQLDDARRNAAAGEAIDFSLLTDGLAAEREQGITIDVAYRYFTTPRRKFIIADTPGHLQYTRNMATGASTANVAIILIDARLGVLQQSRRHAYIASLLGIPHLLVAVNKMDLVDYKQERFEEIRAQFASFVAKLRFTDVTYLPVSALCGDNVVSASEQMPWYQDGTLLDFLETVDIGGDHNLEDFRYPVQMVLRPNQDYRGFAGQIGSGVVSVGDEVAVYPSGMSSRVKAIDTYDGPLERAFAPMSVTLRLEDEIDVSRGDVIVSTARVPHLERTFDAHVVWMTERTLDTAKSYLLKHGTRYIRAGLHDVSWKLDMDTLESVETSTLELNDIGAVTVTAHQPLCFDAYPENRAMGSFVIIDTLTNNTVGAGMIIGPAPEKGSCTGHRTGVSTSERRERLRQTGTLLVIRGEQVDRRIGYGLERRLFDQGHFPYVWDMASVEPAERGSVARAFCEAGLLTICFAGEHEAASLEAAVDAANCLSVYVNRAASEKNEGAIFLQMEEGRLEHAVSDLLNTLRSRGILLGDE